MEAAVWVASCSFGVAVLGVLLYVISSFMAVKQNAINLNERIRILEMTQEGILDFLIDRAEMAGKAKGFFQKTAPLRITNQNVRELYKPIEDELKSTYKTFYSQFGIRMTERQIWMAIQVQFGQWISDNVCLQAEPRMTLGECITFAMIIASEHAESNIGELDYPKTT